MTISQNRLELAIPVSTDCVNTWMLAAAAVSSKYCNIASYAKTINIVKIVNFLKIVNILKIDICFQHFLI